MHEVSVKKIYEQMRVEVVVLAVCEQSHSVVGYFHITLHFKQIHNL